MANGNNSGPANIEFLLEMCWQHNSSVYVRVNHIKTCAAHGPLPFLDTGSDYIEIILNGPELRVQTLMPSEGSFSPGSCGYTTEVDFAFPGTYEIQIIMAMMGLDANNNPPIRNLILMREVVDIETIKAADLPERDTDRFASPGYWLRKNYSVYSGPSTWWRYRCPLKGADAFDWRPFRDQPSLANDTFGSSEKIAECLSKLRPAGKGLPRLVDRIRGGTKNDR